MTTPKAFDNAAAREKEFHPTNAQGQTITSWQDRARYLKELWNRMVNLEARVAALETGNPPPPGNGEEPPPATKTYAPQTYNIGSGGQDPRFCTMGLPKNNSNQFVDTDGILYDNNGLNVDGRRKSSKIVAGLKPADMMDGKEACEGYEWQGKTFPGGKTGWPAESYTL